MGGEKKRVAHGRDARDGHVTGQLVWEPHLCGMVQ